MTVFDCVMLYNEIDMLEARMHILRDVVDVFVVCESNLTHSGDEKPLHFSQHAERFEQFNVSYVIGNLSEYPDNWTRERGQRSQLQRGLSGIRYGDTVIVADVDEIPRPDTVRQFIDSGHRAARFELDMYYYNVNTRVLNGWSIGAVKWSGAHDLNDVRMLNGIDAHTYHDAGWHFSYFGGAEQIRNKLRHFLHHDWTTDGMFADGVVERAIEDGADIWRRGDTRLQIIPTPGNLPAHIIDNRERYEGWFNDVTEHRHGNR